MHLYPCYPFAFGDARTPKGYRCIGVIASGEGVRASPITFGEGYAPVPLYPLTPLGYGVIAYGEGVRASPKAKG